MKFVVALALFGLVAVLAVPAAAYHQAHFDGLRSYLEERGLPLPDALAQANTAAKRESWEDKVCRQTHAFTGPLFAASTNPSLWFAQGVFNGTTRNYIQYYNGTVVPADAAPTYTQQTKYWVIDRYIDTFCVIQNGACSGSVSTYHTFLERFTGPWALHKPTAQGCATSNDAVLGNKDATGAETSPYNWAVSYRDAVTGELFATESLVTTNPDPDNFERDITFKTYGAGIPDGIYVSLIHQVRVVNPF
ncbi:hypothetical protein QOT17_007126 [Balamuthia mandrillaris]